MNRRVRWTGLWLALVMMASLIAACGSKNGSDDAQIIGVALPSRSAERWLKDGENIKRELEGKGYKVDLQYAEEDVQVQISQLENMITSGADCLVITPVDATALVNVLQQAADAGIKIIAYDRLLMDTKNVSYFVTFNNRAVGQNTTKKTLEMLKVDERSEPLNLEIFTGDSADHNAHTFYTGVMDVLQAYLDNGKVVIASGQTQFQQVGIPQWSQENAQKRMENIISGFYSQGKQLHGVLSPADVFAYGIAAALEGSGIQPGTDRWPIITGQDAEVMAVKNILSGKQAFSNWRDARVESAKLLTLVEAVMKGSEPEINNTTDFDNGVMIVPTFQADATIITKDNVISELVDSGYYSKEELGIQ